jgi:type II secretory pathway component PulF
MFQQLLDMFASDPLEGVAALLLVFLFYIVAGLLPICGALYLCYYLLTLPLRRNERVRLFIHLLEIGLKEGRTPEAALQSAAATGDPSLSPAFRALAAHFTQGLSFRQGLELLPGLLPAQIRAMLRVGERIGDLAKVLPACRQYLKDGVSQVRGALNYLLLLAFAVTPAIVLIPGIVRIKVLPSFKAVFAEMLGGQPLPAFTRLVFSQSDLIAAIQLLIIGCLWLLLLAYLGGPTLRRWLPGFVDWLGFVLPWRRKRLERDFSAMLAVLLDTEVPELEAVTLAAEATANQRFRQRADQVCARLKAGVKLPEALQEFEGAGELSWRLRNALQTGGGFLRALDGWHQALDAKAFQLEQNAAQIATTSFVLLNGLAVAAIVIAIFLVLIQLLNQATLW